MKAGFPVSGFIYESYLFSGFRLYMKAICFPVSGCIWKLYVSRFPGVYESYMFPGFRLYIKAIVSWFPVVYESYRFPVWGCIYESHMFSGFWLYMKAIVSRFAAVYTVKPLITNTSKEFIKCRLENFSMSFILYYVNFSICENK